MFLQCDILVLFDHGSSQIHSRQQNENVGLQQRHSDMQSQKYDRNSDRNQRKENQSDHVTSEHVGVQTGGQRKHASEMAYQLNRDHKRRERGHGTGKGFEISDPRVFESLSLVVHKSANGASQRNHRHSCRGFKAGDHANQVAYQNEEAERHQKWSEALAVMPDDFLALTLNKPVSAFEDVLQCARLVDGKPGAQQSKQDDEKQKYQNLHSRRIGDWRMRIFRFNMERPQ